MIVGCAKLDDQLIRYLVEQGFTWSEERQCFFMLHEKFQKWNNYPVDHLPMSFVVDDFHRAVHLPYGGDCKRSAGVFNEEDNRLKSVKPPAQAF